MRITNSMMMSQYNRDLSTSLNHFNSASQRVTTGMAFQTASEAPSSAVKAYQLRREFQNNEIYLTNAKNLEGILASQEAGVMEIHKMAETISTDILQGVTGTTNPEDREIIATKLDALKESMVGSLNAQFADNNVYGGSQTKEPPFTVNGEGDLMFRGINVNTKDPDELAKLEEYANEEVLIDLGFGLSTNDDGSIDSQSAMNTALPGIKFMGFGHSTVDGKEIPNNMFSLISDISDELRKPADEFTMEGVKPYIDKFGDASSKVLMTATEIGSKDSFLESTTKRLEDARLNLNEKIVNVEKVDPAEAVMDLKMHDFAYKAALAIGNQILQPSFIDFMK